MTRIAFVNMSRYRGSVNRAGYVFLEPTHLLAMHNICNQGIDKDQGEKNKSDVFQYGFPSERESIAVVIKFRPDILGLSFVGPREEDFTAAHAIMKGFGETLPHLVIGGTDTTHNTARYLSEFSPYFAQRPPYFIVRGPGEHFFVSLAGTNFDIKEDLFYRRLGVPINFDSGGAIISDLPRLPLDQQGFVRPDNDTYPLWDSRIAEVKWEAGCWAKCSFCANKDFAVDYRSPDLAEAEVKYLVDRGIHEFSLTSANFTAHPRKATAIIERVQKPYYRFYFGSRVDTLCAAIHANPECWKEFGRQFNTIDLGVESLLAVRLAPGRLGKYITRRQAEAQNERLRFILNFFRNSKTIIRFYMIPFDWQSDLSELSREFGGIRKIMEEFSFLIVPFDLLKHILHHENGSSLSQTMRPADYYNFKRDPRALLLWALLQEKIAVVEEYLGNNPEPTFRRREASVRLIKYILACIKGLEGVGAERFNISPVLAGINGVGKAEIILKALLTQLEPSERAGLEKYFKDQFNEAFPEIAAFYARPPKRSAWERAVAFLRLT